MPHHLLIAGTGRSGTSFLVRLLHELGLDTHLSRLGGSADWSSEANAGLEDMLGESTTTEAPYVVKSPWLYQWIDVLLQSERVIDGVILPMRELNDAVASRTVVEYQSMHRALPELAEQSAPWESWGSAPGGIVFSTHPLDEARLLATAFFKVVQRLTEADIPMYFPAFPRLVENAGYLYDRIGSSLPRRISREEFVEAHRRVADPSQVRVRATPVFTPVQAENLALKRELVRLRAEHEQEIALLRAELAKRR